MTIRKLRATQGHLLVAHLDYEVIEATNDDGVHYRCQVQPGSGLVLAPTMHVHAGLVVSSGSEEYAPGDKLVYQRASGAYLTRWEDMDVQRLDLEEPCPRCQVPFPRYPVLARLVDDALEEAPGRLLVEPIIEPAGELELHDTPTNRGRALDGRTVMWVGQVARFEHEGVDWVALREGRRCRGCGYEDSQIIATVEP